jgi:hypothetical protein
MSPGWRVRVNVRSAGSYRYLRERVFQVFDLLL